MIVGIATFGLSLLAGAPAPLAAALGFGACILFEIGRYIFPPSHISVSRNSAASAVSPTGHQFSSRSTTVKIADLTGESSFLTNLKNHLVASGFSEKSASEKMDEIRANAQLFPYESVVSFAYELNVSRPLLGSSSCNFHFSIT
ncbi:hypothetical protein [Endozoicomonas elysicola]|uniref:Uncharacterized protein n=1 Tax=Endozoicomonas elysicola TaxID=305900 RepID=A0A081KC26_9GAMM|nr:hypothetical protein [Endozoicomonas elysicola]KEI71702.1 hypothetical protein GV64_14000 [Endozoicomonas elysicola]